MKPISIGLTAGGVSALAFALFVVAGAWDGGSTPVADDTSHAETRDRGESGSDDIGRAIQSDAPNAPASADAEPAALEELNRTYRALNHNPEYPDLSMRIREMRARRPGQAIDPERVVESLRANSSWEVADEPGAGLKLTDEERYDGRVFIDFSPQAIEALVPGDNMNVLLDPSAGEHKMEIDRVEVHGDGTITWHGHLDDFANANKLAITRGESLTVGGFTTPRGHYTLQARGDAGWVVPSSTLFKYDPNQTDAIKPPDTGAENGPADQD